MEYTQQFNLLVEKAASEKAFSLDVLKTINEMRDQFEEMVNENKALNERLNNCNSALSEAIVNMNKARERVLSLETMEQSLKEGLEMLSRNQFELNLKKSVADHGEKMAVSLFQTVFANTTLRKTVNRSFNSHYDNQKNVQVNDVTPCSETETIIEE